MEEVVSTCPGCGLQRPTAGPVPGDGYNASGECWLIYCELSGYSLSRGYEPFVHQHVVDAYGLLHGKPTASNIGVAFTLVGLYLAVEKGFSGRDVQRAHMQLARQRKQWPLFDRPAPYASMTVADVMQEEPGDARDAAILRWAAAVWDVCCEESRAWARATCVELLHIPSPTSSERRHARK